MFVPFGDGRYFDTIRRVSAAPQPYALIYVPFRDVKGFSDNLFLILDFRFWILDFVRSVPHLVPSIRMFVRRLDEK
jgi:hypothetical protein